MGGQTDGQIDRQINGTGTVSKMHSEIRWQAYNLSISQAQVGLPDVPGQSGLQNETLSKLGRSPAWTLPLLPLKDPQPLSRRGQVGRGAAVDATRNKKGQSVAIQEETHSGECERAEEGQGQAHHSKTLLSGATHRALSRPGAGSLSPQGLYPSL